MIDDREDVATLTEDGTILVDDGGDFQIQMLHGSWFILLEMVR